MTRPRLFTPFDWIMAIGTLILIALIIWFCFILRPAASAGISISSPANNSEQAAGVFTLNGTGTPGEVLEVFQDDISLGTTTVGANGQWEQIIPSVGQGGGGYTYRVTSTSNPDRETQTRINFTAVTSTGAVCDREYILTIRNGQTFSQPFRFGGQGKGESYIVTVKRGERLIGSREMKLDATCAWGFDSRPGVGTITYEVREKGAAADSTPLSTMTLTVR